MLGVQEVQAARDIKRDAAAAPPPAERVRCAAAARAALQRAEQVAALCSDTGSGLQQYSSCLKHAAACAGDDRAAWGGKLREITQCIAPAILASTAQGLCTNPSNEGVESI